MIITRRQLRKIIKEAFYSYHRNPLPRACVELLRSYDRQGMPEDEIAEKLSKQYGKSDLEMAKRLAGNRFPSEKEILDQAIMLTNIP
tara:strand:+ start:358 stop:618 length:261 start_codon:yes stop_codon:yes gene_type:complete